MRDFLIHQGAEMKVACVSGFASWWGNYPVNILDLDEGETVGGGEENFLRCAVGLKALGHDVTAWHCGEAGRWRGVEFKDVSSDLYGSLVSDKWDVVAAWSALRPLEWAIKGARRLFVQQLNDLYEPGDWSRVDCVVSPSAEHAKQLPNWGWKKRPFAVVHNGLDAEFYGGPSKEKYDPANPFDGVGRTTIPDWKSRPPDVGYWSSPDRGLHHLLKAWPEVKRLVPEARLHVFYELDRLLKSASCCPGPLGDRVRLLGALLPRAKADKSIVFHGAVPRNKLRLTQVQCRVMAYPYVPIAFCEGFCGSVNQSIAAGCHVLTTSRDALPSLYSNAVTWLPSEPEKIDAVLATTIVRALTDEEWSEQRVAAARPHRFNYTWDRAAKEFERACRGEGWELTGEGDNAPIDVEAR